MSGGLLSNRLHEDLGRCWGREGRVFDLLNVVTSVEGLWSERQILGYAARSDPGKSDSPSDMLDPNRKQTGRAET